MIYLIQYPFFDSKYGSYEDLGMLITEMKKKDLIIATI